MSVTLNQFTADAIDLADGDAVKTFVALAVDLAELGTVQLRLLRFGYEAYSGPPINDASAHVFPNDPSLAELRAITLLELRFGDKRNDPIVKFERSASHPHKLSIAVDPERFRNLEGELRTAQAEFSRITSEVNQAGGHQRHQKEQERGQAQARVDNAKKQFDDAAPELVRRMLVCVNACHKVGLVRPAPEAHAPQETHGSSRLADEVSALRATLASQQRNAADVAREQADDYSKRCESLRQEHDERTKRLEAEFAERQQRLEEEVRAREVAAKTRLDEAAAREARLELNDEKAERRRLRRELQDATKARAEKPDLSSDAKNSFGRVVKATGWTAIVSAVVLVSAVIAPFFAPSNSSNATELTYLGWSLRALAGVTLGASLVYYVRALAQRARLIAETEVRSRQFAFDVDRAQWLVEMALEYDKSGKPLSPELIAAFSRGLFDAEHTSGGDGPMGLKELLVNAEGLEVSLSRRGVRRALRGAGVQTDPPPS